MGFDGCKAWLGVVVVFAALVSVACGKESAVQQGCIDPGPGPAPGPVNPNTALMFNKYTQNGNDLSAFVAVRDSIVTNAVGLDPNEVGTSFRALAAQGPGVQNIDSFKTNLANFLVQAYGGPANYNGRTMKAAHAGLMITNAQYDVFISKAVVPALTGNGVTDASDLAAFAAPVTDANFKASIVTCK